MTPEPTPPALETPRRRVTARDLALIASFAAFMAVLGLPGSFYLPGMTVPITAQTLGVILAALVIGPWRAAAAMGTFLVLVAAGLPLLAGGRGGLAVFTGPAAGYLWSWTLAALVTGLVLVAWRARPIPLFWFFVAGLVGTFVIYLIGVPVLSAVTDISLWAAIKANFAFFPGDGAKLVAAAIVAGGVHRGYPALLGRGRRTAAVAPSAPASSDVTAKG